MDTEASVKVLDYGGDGAEPKPVAHLGTDPGWWEALGPIGVAKILVIVALVSWLYGDHFFRLYRIWQQPDWSHGFLLPVFCLYLVHMKRAELLRRGHVGSLWGLGLILFAMAVYAISIRRQYGYPQPLSILVMITGVVLLLRGWRTLWLAGFPIAFLFLAIPPPARIYRHLSQPLQQIAAAVSAFLLNALPGVIEIEHAGINLAFYMEGGHSGTFTVAGACSGMRSLMAFVALGLAMAYMGRRPTWHRIILCACIVPVAVSCNILRVIITGSLQMYGYEELAGGSSHAILGLLMFALGFMTYFAVLWVLDHLVVEGSDEPDVDEAISAGGQA